MSKDEHEQKRASQLMHFMAGYRRGAAAGATIPSQMAVEEFQAGHQRGREDAQRAYLEASATYGATLSPLR